MAEGCDLYFAEEVLKLQILHNDVELRAAVPCPEQASSWSAAQKRRYEEILSQCSDVNILQPSYTRGCMQRRNKYMVDRSSTLLACYNGLPGGTMNTIVYADREGLEVHIIDISGLTGGEKNEL